MSDRKLKEALEAQKPNAFYQEYEGFDKVRTNEQGTLFVYAPYNPQNGHHSLRNRSQYPLQPCRLRLPATERFSP
jgi:hypothetical protein